MFNRSLMFRLLLPIGLWVWIACAASGLFSTFLARTVFHNSLLLFVSNEVPNQAVYIGTGAFLYLIDPAHDRSMILMHSVSSENVSIAPDGHMVMERFGNITTLDWRTGDSQSISPPATRDLNPVFSPDGSRIALYSDVDGQLELFVMDRDGQNRRLISAGVSIQEDSIYPSWLPDSRRVLFYGSASSTGYYVVDSLTGTIQFSTEDLGIPWYSSWSANGQHITFATQRSRIQIANILPDGSIDSRDMLQVETADNFQDRNPVWSGNSHYIAFVRLILGGADEFAIGVSDNQGSMVHTIMLQTQGVRGLSWSPDGTQIAFSACINSVCHAHVANIDGTGVRQISPLALVNVLSNVVWLP